MVGQSFKRGYRHCRSGCCAVGSAPALGAGGRAFESPHSDHVGAKFALLRRFVFYCPLCRGKIHLQANAGCTCPLPLIHAGKGFRGQRLHRLLVRLWCPSRCVLRRSMTHCCAFVHRQLLNPPKKYGAIWSRIFLYFWSVPGPFPRPSEKQRQIGSLLLFTSFNICSTADFCCPVR